MSLRPGRPLHGIERERGDHEAVRVWGDGRTIDLDQEGGGTSFSLNGVFGKECDQGNFFLRSGVPDLLQAALDGYAATVFAFGQTGSGKTFTITGPPSGVQLGQNEALLQRSIQYIFAAVTEDTERKFTIRGTYLEIYNEQVLDLLNPSSQNLPVRWSKGRGFYVENLFVVECEDIQDMLSVLEEGLHNRHMGSHELNRDSSRSHSILTIHIESETYDPADGHAVVCYGKVSFVDLAGSEQVKQTMSSGDRLVETRNINQSLFTLGKVISSLSKIGRTKATHIPYRDSKLTKLLQDSIGGNGVTLMIACISPASRNLEETSRTLRYATRAMNIKNRPVVQMDPQEQLILGLKREVVLLRAEVVFLKERLREAGLAPPESTSDRVGHSPSIASEPIQSRRPPRSTSSERLTPDPVKPPPPPFMTSSRPASIRRPSLTSSQQRSAPIEPSSVRSSRPPSDVMRQLEKANALVGRFRGEVEKLSSTNRDLFAEREALGRDFAMVVEENSRLGEKLVHLEKVFVGLDVQFGQDPRSSTREIDRPPSVASDESGPPESKPPVRSARRGSDAAQSASFQKLSVENIRLQKLVKQLQALVRQKNGDELPPSRHRRLPSGKSLSSVPEHEHVEEIRQLRHQLRQREEVTNAVLLENAELRRQLG